MGREQSRVNKKERKRGRAGEEMKRRSLGQSANNEKMGKRGKRNRMQVEFAQEWGV